MPACQNDNVAVAMSPDAVMKSICKWYLPDPLDWQTQPN
jgi:hypothetical protein